MSQREKLLSWKNCQNGKPKEISGTIFLSLSRCKKSKLKCPKFTNLSREKKTLKTTPKLSTRTVAGNG